MASQEDVRPVLVQHTSSSNLYPDVPVGMPMPTTPSHGAVPSTPTQQSPMPLQLQHGAMLTVQMEPAVAETLAGRGFPRGLARQIVGSVQSFPIRMLIVDNSGSMNSQDGSKLMQAGQACRMVGCTRWQELSETLGSVATIAHTLQARTDFLLLNPPGGGQPQFMSVGGAHGDHAPLPVPSLGPVVDDVQLRNMMSSVQPSGTTPLTEAVMQVISLLTPAVSELTRCSQQAVVVLATDGVPNEPQTFLQALMQLQRLPVWLVVRLCTNDDSVVNYWNGLDASLEAPLEVLDDEAGEADEIAAQNPWLTYGPPLHIARTFGLRHRLFDLIDETALMPSQVRDFCELLLGCGELPEPQVEYDDFYSQLSVALASAPSTFDPRTGRRAPWINLKQVRRLRPGALSCPCVVL